MTEKDRIYDAPLGAVSDFAFDDNVAKVFDDMAVRSIPLYDVLHSVSTRIAQVFVQPRSRIYDLGCSTGSLLLRLHQGISDTSVELVGVDSSAAMLERCRRKLSPVALRRTSLIESDIATVPLENASVAFLHYTLQFIEPAKRPAILSSLYRALVPNGCVVIAEKVIHEEPMLDDLLVDLYYDFKRANGYSQLEISQKREALERVLRPTTLDGNIALLKTAGFDRVETVLKCWNFATIVAFKS